jgi:hypothetical protein
MPQDGNVTLDPSILGGDDLWTTYNLGWSVFSDVMFRIALGYQNAASPLANYWEGLYQGLRVCNIFLENVGTVPDLPLWERIQWEGEANFMKAYYHFCLLRMYGPIPLVKENLSIDAKSEEIRVSRDPVDDCVDYIVSLLDSAIIQLPDKIINPTKEQGRATKLIAASLKAKVLVFAASPLFNGNNDQATLVNRDGTKLFNPEKDIHKWERAATACKEALELCPPEVTLFKYTTAALLSDTIKQELTIRNTFTEKWNSEIIWANTQTREGASGEIQRQASAGLNNSQFQDQTAINPLLQPVVKIGKLFYTNHGVPIEEDKSWRGLDLYALRTGTDAEKYYIKQDYTTIQLHFDREPRFYATLGFDGGIWYGQGRYGNNPNDYYYVAGRASGAQHVVLPVRGPVTGYFWKKCVYFENVQTGLGSYTFRFYPWPLIRLADLYLLYAEAINEAEGPNGPNSGDLFRYIDLVREKAGLEGVKDSWNKYTDSQKYNTQIGMRQIIHRERLIEFAYEGQRFWDLRRWREAPDEYNQVVEAWNLYEDDPVKYYKPVALWKQTFLLRDYFWPIATSDVERNPNLVQNIGW